MILLLLLVLLLAPLTSQAALIAQWSFNAGTGTTVADSVGSNTGTFNLASWTAGRSGAAAGKMQGTTAYVALTNTIVQNRTNVSVAAWIKPDMGGTGNRRIIYEPVSNSNGVTRFGFLVNGSDQLQCLGRGTTNDPGGSSRGEATTSTVPLGVWSHVVCVWNGTAGTIQIYLNGAAQTTTVTGTGIIEAFANTAPNSAPRLGVGSDNTEPFVGTLDEVHLYDNALTSTDVTNLYNGYLGTDITSGLLAQWKLDNDWTDSSGWGLTLAPTGSPTFITGKIGTHAANFTGSTTYASRANTNLGLQNQAEVTVAFWMRTTTTSARNLVLKPDSSDPNGFVNFRAATTATAGNLVFGVEKPPSEFPSWQTSGLSINDGAWHSVVATFRKNVIGSADGAMYVDGTAQSLTFTASSYSSNFFFNDAGTSTMFLATANTLTNFYPGDLDEVRLYSRALTASDAAAFHALGTVTPPAGPSRLPGIGDNVLHPPPDCGPYAYETFTPAAANFPAVGATYTDPIFGETVTRLTNIYPSTSGSGIQYGINGRWNADSTAYLHQTPSGVVVLNPATGATIRSGVPYPLTTTDEVSFDPVNADIYYYTNGNVLSSYSISGNSSSTVKNFGATLGGLGQSNDWIDKTGDIFLLNIAGNFRIWKKSTDTLYTGSLSVSLGSGWAGLSPDGNYVITSIGGTGQTSYAINHGTTTLSTSGVLFWDAGVVGSSDHGDLISASDGNTYAILPNLTHAMAGATRHYFRVLVTNAITPGSSTQLTATGNQLLIPILSSNTAGNGDFACGATGMYQDWCYAVVADPADTLGSPGTWYAYRQELFLIHMLPPFEIRRLMHHRARPHRGFCRQVRQSANWDGTKVIFTSPFSATDSADCGYSDLYRYDAP